MVVPITATRWGVMTGVVMSTSKNASGVPELVTLKCWLESGRSGQALRGHGGRSCDACANQSPGEQLVDRATATLSELSSCSCPRSRSGAGPGLGVGRDGGIGGRAAAVVRGQAAQIERGVAGDARGRLRPPDRWGDVGRACSPR